MPHTSRRIKHQGEVRRLAERYMKLYDQEHTHTLSRAEVKHMVQDIMRKANLDVDHTDEEVELIMRCGGSTAHAELTAKDLPLAIAIAHAVRDDANAFHHLFVQFDTSHTGKLNAHELTNLLAQINGGLAPGPNDIDYILKQCEPRGTTDPIPEDQLKCAIACWYCLSPPANEKIKQMFKDWDTHGTGYISKDELKAVMTQLNQGQPVEDEEVSIIFKKVDQNHDGKIQYEEFVEWVMQGGAEKMGASPGQCRVEWSTKLFHA